MAVYCEDLIHLKHFSKAKLVAGGSGIHNYVSWAHICTSYPVKEWFRGGELLFYVENEAHDETHFLQALLELNPSALVYIVKDADQETLPAIILEMANKKEIPVFEMPWTTKVFDFVQEVIYLIVEKDKQSKKTQQFLEKVLFSHESSVYNASELASFYNMEIYENHFVSMIGINSHELSFEHGLIFIDVLLHAIDELNRQEGVRYFTTEYSNSVVILGFVREEKAIEQAMEQVVGVYQSISARYFDIELALGFSRIHKRCEEIKTSFQEALKVMFMLKANHYHSNVLHYRDLGIIKLLFELSDTEELTYYYKENIDPLIQYDEKHSAELIGTLKCYLLNNRHLVHTAQELYIHRNTLIYRLSTIKKLLDTTLDDALTNLELFNSILIYEFMQAKKPIV